MIISVGQCPPMVLKGRRSPDPLPRLCHAAHRPQSASVRPQRAGEGRGDWSPDRLLRARSAGEEFRGRVELLLCYLRVIYNTRPRLVRRGTVFLLQVALTDCYATYWYIFKAHCCHSRITHTLYLKCFYRLFNGFSTLSSKTIIKKKKTNSAFGIL